MSKIKVPDLIQPRFKITMNPKNYKYRVVVNDKEETAVTKEYTLREEAEIELDRLIKKYPMRNKPPAT